MNSPESPSSENRVRIDLGSRVVLRGGLFLGTTPSTPSESGLSHLLAELERWQGPGVLIFTDGLFASPDALLNARHVIAAHPSFEQGLKRFLEQEDRQVLYLSEHDEVAAREALAPLGVACMQDIVLECVTIPGIRRVLVTHAHSSADDLTLELRDSQWKEGIERLEDPSYAVSFVSSRMLYRRLRWLLWIVPLVAIVVGIGTRLAFVAHPLRRLGRGHTHNVIDRITNAPWHIRFLYTVAAIVIAEILVGLIAGFIARRVFAATSARSTRRRGVIPESDELPSTLSEQANLDKARAFLSAGGSGVICGGPIMPSLTHLDTGFLAVPGASASVIREHYGRLGLPPLFLEHAQESQVILEASADLHVRLELFDRCLPPATRVERLIAGETLTSLPPEREGLTFVAGWPDAGAWPGSPDLLTAPRQARRIRRLAAVSLFLTGLFDLLVAVVPPFRDRLHTVLTYLPLSISQSAAAAVALTGIALVMLSRGILRGQHRSWLIAVVLLSVSTALHIAHAASAGAIIVSLAVLLFLIVERRWFLGTTDRGSLTGALPTIVLIVAVAILAAFLGVELSNLRRGSLPSWPLVLVGVTERLVGVSSVKLPDRIDDFISPVMLTIGVGVVATVLYLVTRPVVDRRLANREHGDSREENSQRARDIVTRHGKGTLDYFALRDDKQFFFYGDSVVAYAVYGGIALVSPDPIGPENERVQVWGAFRSFCDVHGWSPGVIGAAAEWLSLYDDSGMRWLYLGDEAVVDVTRFSLEGKKMKGLRQACTRLERNGYTTEFLDPSSIDPARVPGLLELMGMNRRGDEERGFAMMLGRLFDPRDSNLIMIIVTGPDGAPAAMCQFVPSPGIQGYSLDLMRRDPGEHPNGLLDFALCETIAHLKCQGVQGLSLNFSAFRSTLDGEKGDGLTQRVERWGLRRLSAVLPIETLWKFNEKYQPNWLARHLVFASPEVFVQTVTAAFRAESLTEIPLVGRFFSQDPSNRPGTVVPAELLEGRAAPRSE